MNNRRNKVMQLIIIILEITIIAVMIACFKPFSNNAPDIVQTPTPVVNFVTATPAISFVPTITPMPTATPVPTVSPVPTATPAPIVINTATPPVLPTVTPTPEVVIISTPSPTVVITPNQTVTPTATPIQEIIVTAIPSPVVTQIPTPTPKPILQLPEFDAGNFEKFKDEINKMCSGNDILINRNELPKYDLFEFVSLDSIDAGELFDFLKNIYINNISRWINIEASNSLDTVQRLKSSLDSCLCHNCNKVVLKYNEENSNIMRHIFNGIPKNNYEDANKIMIDFLFLNTNEGPYGPHERVLLICDCN